MFFHKLKRELFRIQAQLFYPKELRKKYVDEKIKKQEELLYEKEKRKHVFGVSYSVFDGLELLEQSIKSIRQEVDYVNLVWQDISWNGRPSSEDVGAFVQKMKNKGLADEIIKFTPDISLKAARNEEIKRNIGLEAAKKIGCDYFMTMDCDEFYMQNEMREAKRFILKHNITHSYCCFVCYGLKPTIRLVEPSNYAVHFFCKINEDSRLGSGFGKNENRVAVVDKSRELSDFYGAKYYFLQNVKMHHMSFVRRSFSEKFYCSSCQDLKYVDGKTIEKIKQSLSNALSVDVPNVFDIHI